VAAKAVATSGVGKDDAVDANNAAAWAVNADEAEAEAAGLDGAATYGAEADNTTVEAAEGRAIVEAVRGLPLTEEDLGRCF
jgi:hypothetical protein